MNVLEACTFFFQNLSVKPPMHMMEDEGVRVGRMAFCLALYTSYDLGEAPS